jgi:hypothetical protein
MLYRFRVVQHLSYAVAATHRVDALKLAAEGKEMITQTGWWWLHGAVREKHQRKPVELPEMNLKTRAPDFTGST